MTNEEANKLVKVKCPICKKFRFVKGKSLQKNFKGERTPTCKDCRTELFRRDAERFSDIRHRQEAALNAQRKIPPFPTNARPGSEEKIRILQERYENGFELFHPEEYPRFLFLGLKRGIDPSRPRMHPEAQEEKDPDEAYLKKLRRLARTVLQSPEPPPQTRRSRQRRAPGKTRGGLKQRNPS